jgi:peroxiredoxin
VLLEVALLPESERLRRTNTSDQVGMALESETDVLERGDEAPEFELRGTDGETHSLTDFANYEAVLLVFTWLTTARTRRRSSRS